MTQTLIERFLNGEQRSTGRTAVSDSRELLMDKLDDILDSSIADLTHANTTDLFDAIPNVLNDMEHWIEVHAEAADEEAFEHVTRRAVQLMGLVIALYAQALEKEEARVPDDEEDEDT